MTERMQFEDAERIRREFGEHLGRVLDDAIGLQQEILSDAPAAAATGSGRDPSNSVEVRVAPGVMGVRIAQDWEIRVGVEGLAGAVRAAYSEAQRSRVSVIADEAPRDSEEPDSGAAMIAEAKRLGDDPEFRASMQDVEFVDRLHSLFEQARAAGSRKSDGRGPRGIAAVQLDRSGGMQFLRLDERRISGMAGRMIAEDIEAAYRSAVAEHDRGQALNTPENASRYVAVLSGRDEELS